MDLNKLISRTKGMIINPVKEWDNIIAENNDKNTIIKEFALPLIILVAIATLIGGLSSPRLFAPSVSYSVANAIISLIVSLGAIYIASYVINELSVSFGAEKNLENAFKLVIYSSTPAYLASIVANLHWTLGFVNIFALYSIYLFWLGASQVIKISEEKKIGYVIVSFLILLISYLVLALVLGGVILSSIFTFR